MGRAYKQRKLKKTRRVKVRSKSVKSRASLEKEKKRIKPWEYLLFAAALAFGILAIVFFARTGNVTPDIEPAPTAVESPAAE